jgi:uncharacterized membrane protein YgdD (TMEM256/DUF423 family)
MAAHPDRAAEPVPAVRALACGERYAARMRWAVIGALSAALAVIVGAFGTHGLRARLDPAMLAVFETGARYHMYHALALIVAGLVADRRPGGAAGAAAGLFVAGTVLFSGSLYALALSGVRAFGAITPIGGLCFIMGWIALAIALARRRP